MGIFQPKKRAINKDLTDEYTATFDGIGFILEGQPVPKAGGRYDGDFVYQLEVYVDGKKMETANIPASFTRRRYDLTWKYQLASGNHTVRLQLLNPDKEFTLRLRNLIVFGNKPILARY